MFWGIKVNENGESDIIKNYSCCFGDLDILSCVRLSRLEWIGHVNRMDSKRKVSQVLNNNSLGSRLKGRPKKRWWSCVQTDVNKCKTTNWKGMSKNSGDWKKSMKEAKICIGL
jgi:hypothetical protein